MTKGKIISIVIFIVGLVILIFPYITNTIYQVEVDDMYLDWIKIRPVKIEEIKENEVDVLYKAMQDYNTKIYNNKQQGITDPFAFPSVCFDLTKYNIEDNIVGFITIDKMDIRLPIYLGATQENMALGATQLGLTSLPIGGINTNCVIAAHRGYSTKAMFRNIELLEIGDEIIIENYWDTLYYEVCEIKIIDPADVDSILIQDNKDLITLSTCHPYRHNYQRYLVYAQRKK